MFTSIITHGLGPYSVIGCKLPVQYYANKLLAQYYANKVCKSCASLAGLLHSCLADVIGFCCNLQPCMLHVASCIAVVIGVLRKRCELTIVVFTDLRRTAASQ